MEKNLYGLVSFAGGCGVLVQVSFNKEELEEIAEYLNQKGRYYKAYAKVKIVDEKFLEWYWPRKTTL